MGAYFQTQLRRTTPTTPTPVIAICQSGLKFLESFYFNNPTHRAIYAYLVEHATAENPIKVATVCDYDERLDDVEVVEWTGQQARYDENAPINDDVVAIEEDFDYSLMVSTITMIAPESDENKLIEQFFVRNVAAIEEAYEKKTGFPASTGYLVCPEAKSYLDLSAIVKLASEAKEKYNAPLISPLAVRTRLHNSPMGGGDADLEGLSLGDYGYWYNKAIYYTDCKPTENEYEDITVDSCFYENNDRDIMHVVDMEDCF